jgi:gp16 family phage-associated protein
MSNSKRVKTAAQVKAEFNRTGKSITGWARAHGYTAPLVFEVLRGRLKGKRGKAHEVAVLLGLKDGVIEREAA